MQMPKQVVTTAAELADLLDSVIAVLEQEQQALQDSNTEPVLTVTDRKQTLLLQLNQLHPELIRRLADTNGNDDNNDDMNDDIQTMKRIKLLIPLCQRYNKENAALVAQGLQICKRSIDFLHGGVQQQSIERYSPDGHTTSIVSSRVIGTA